jgi:hypothetical protein
MEPAESSEPDKPSLTMENLFPTVTWKDRIRASFRKRDSDSNSNEDSQVAPVVFHSEMGYLDFTCPRPDEWDKWDEWDEPYDKEERMYWRREEEIDQEISHLERCEENVFYPDDLDARLAQLREQKAPRLDEPCWKEDPGLGRKMLEWIETQLCEVFRPSFVPAPSVRFRARVD